MHALEWYFWIAPNVILAACLVLLLRRHQARKYPFLLAFLASQLLTFLVQITTDLLILPHIATVTTYRWLLVAGTGLNAAIEIGVLYELADTLVSSRPSLKRPLRAFFRWTAAAVIVIAAIVSALFPASGTEPVVQAFQVFDFSSSLLSLGLLLAIIIFTRALRVSWRGLPAGIVLGLGVSATVEMAASVFYSLGRPAYVPLDFLRGGAFHICAVIWLVYILLPERAPKFKGFGLQKSDLESWDQELQRMVQR